MDAVELWSLESGRPSIAKYLASEWFCLTTVYTFRLPPVFALPGLSRGRGCAAAAGCARLPPLLPDPIHEHCDKTFILNI